MVFGLLYAVVLYAVAECEQRFGSRALYPVAALSGLTDVDAITLSTARLLDSGALDVATGWRLILVGILANLVFKLGAVALLGPRVLTARVAALFGISLLGGGVLLALWPA